MAIKLLADYIINKLKAGEIVERPASICKELIENSLDANASHIVLHITWGGKERIQVDDDGKWIPWDDMRMVLTRYATSKISKEDDLYDLATYWFRGEALASIAEVSHTTVISKTDADIVATKLSNETGSLSILPQPVAWLHGTTVIIENLFYNTPVRQKFLKSSQTEYYYCYDVFLGYAIMHWDKHRELYKDNKLVFDLPAWTDFLERFSQLYKSERIDHLRILDFDDSALRLYGVFSDPTISFGSPEHIKIFVNQRPVQDRVLKKAIMQAYDRQLSNGLYPLAFLFVDIAGDSVDVNVHPRKQEVRFADPNSLYQCVLQAVRQSLGEQKIMYVDSQQLANLSWASFVHSSLYAQGDYASDNWFSSNVHVGDFWSQFSNISNPLHTQPNLLSQHRGFELIVDSSIPQEETLVEYLAWWADLPIQWKIIGQLWDMYILLEDNDAFYMVDQHALAERIAYETMKIRAKEDVSRHTLLQPVSVSVSPWFLVSQYEETMQWLWFDVSALSDSQIAVYAIPSFFNSYIEDLEQIVRIIMSIDDPNYDTIADMLYAEKACKASIKAWQRLHPQEMQSLLQQWLQTIPWMFVCQHGRPFMRRFEKWEMNKLFDRQ